MIPPTLLPSQFFSSSWVALLERRAARSVSLGVAHQTPVCPHSLVQARLLVPIRRTNPLALLVAQDVKRAFEPVLSCFAFERQIGFLIFLPNPANGLGLCALMPRAKFGVLGSAAVLFTEFDNAPKPSSGS